MQTAYRNMLLVELLQKNFRIYIPLDGDSSFCFYYTRRNCMVSSFPVKAYMANDGPRCSLHGLEWKNQDTICVFLPDTLAIWIIPTECFPPRGNCTLGRVYDQYRVQYEPPSQSQPEAPSSEAALKAAQRLLEEEQEKALQEEQEREKALEQEQELAQKDQSNSILMDALQRGELD